MVYILGCQPDKIDINDEYTQGILTWYANDYQIIQKSEGDWFLYFDDKIVCQTCKLPILSQIKEFPSISIITRFDSEIELRAFRQAYKLDNQIINLSGNSRFVLGIPFLFQKEGKSLKSLIILRADSLNEGNWLNSLKE